MQRREGNVGQRRGTIGVHMKTPDFLLMEARIEKMQVPPFECPRLTER